MGTVANDAKRAVVGRAEDLVWFDTMPGEQMALRVHSEDVGGAFTIIEARVPAYTGPAPARLLFTFVPGGIDEFFPLIGQTPPTGWLELDRRHDIWTVGETMVVDRSGDTTAEQPVSLSRRSGVSGEGSRS